MDMINREDRIGMYLRPHVDDFVFDELSEGYLERTGLGQILSGVSVPVRKKDLGNISTLNIAISMAFIIGIDPGFKFRDNYVAYIIKCFGKNFAELLRLGYMFLF